MLPRPPRSTRTVPPFPYTTLFPSHGQIAVGFAFCRLLGFELAPRLKAIARQKLALPDVGMRTRLPHLQPILSSPINWDEIEQQYDEMVKYAAAMQTKTA